MHLVVQCSKMFCNKTVIFLFAVIVSATATSFKDDRCTLSDFSRLQEVVESCSDIVVSNLKVPANQTLLLTLKSGSTLLFEGRTYFEYFEWKGPLINITGDNLHVSGAPGSVLDGQGQLYWDSFGGNGGIKKPKFLRIEANYSRIEDINLKNCPVQCASINTDNVVLNNWNIDVSEGDKNNFTGHNTDGFDISSTNLILQNSVVRNQDDCVVINRGANIHVRNVSCYGGHGISISVGFSKTDFKSNSAFNLTFEDSYINRSPNGIHIKTHADSGEGVVQNVTYRNIKLENINNFALNIQQDYAGGQATGVPGTNIPIVDLTLDNITGTMESLNDSPTLEALILCGEGACSNFKFSGINITGAQNESSCNFQPDGYSC